MENDDEFIKFYLYVPKTNGARVFSVRGTKNKNLGTTHLFIATYHI